MDELEQILRHHSAKYPRMTPVDAVKLLYQNEFGGGHLIRDPEMPRQYIRREHAALDPKIPRQPAEPIGNGLVRVYLYGLTPEELEPLADAFFRSAAAHQGSLDSFLRKLARLQNLTAQGVLPFSSETLEAYLQTYAAEGYPMVSHSQTYRDAYAPAYRVVLASLWP